MFADIAVLIELANLSIVTASSAIFAVVIFASAILAVVTFAFNILAVVTLSAPIVKAVAPVTSPVCVAFVRIVRL